MLNQGLYQRMQQKLSPQQIMLMKLMQVPAMSLEQRIKEELETNPALEMSSEDSNNQENNAEEDFNNNVEGNAQEEDSDKENATDNEFSFEDYLDEDDIPDYRMYANNNSENETKDFAMTSGISFYEHLLNQLNLRKFNETDFQIALQIIGNIDDAGYLSRDVEAIADDASFSKNIATTEKDVVKILKVIQDFDPAGIGARNLQECLLIQLKRKPTTRAIKNAILVVEKYFIEFSKKHYDRILKRTKMSEESLKDVIAEILKLNPKPGDFESGTFIINQSIIPDFSVNSIGNNLDIQLNSHNTPELHISRDYQNMLEHYSKTEKINTQNKEAVQFVRSRIDAARWFIDAIKQRQNTLLSVMNTIAKHQEEYFLTGDETKLKPMILKDIAEKLHMDVSTISRVVSSKYVQTPYGTFLLKDLFSEAFQNDDGEEISTKKIKQALKNLVSKEDKSSPLTDDSLLELLKNSGYGVARRTVAKYREQLKIPPSRLRKEL